MLSWSRLHKHVSVLVSVWIFIQHMITLIRKSYLRNRRYTVSLYIIIFSGSMPDINIVKFCFSRCASSKQCFVSIFFPLSYTFLFALGVPINDDLYAWVAVFLLPVNSALNPILYTLTTKLFKQHLAKIIGSHAPRQRNGSPTQQHPGDHSGTSLSSIIGLTRASCRSTRPAYMSHADVS